MSMASCIHTKDERILALDKARFRQGPGLLMSALQAVKKIFGCVPLDIPEPQGVAS